MTSEQSSFLRRHPFYAFYCICSHYPLQAEHLHQFRHVLLWGVICENENIEWSKGLIQTFLNHFKDEHGKLNESLCYNEKLPWSVDFINHFKNLWYWETLGENNKIKDDQAIQTAFSDILEPVTKWLQQPAERMEGIEQREQERTKEYHRRHPYMLYTTVEQIEQDLKINWEYLSWSANLPWSGELIRCYEDKWNWQTLSGNPNIQWTSEMIAGFQDKIFWGGLEKHKNNRGKERITVESGLTFYSNKLWSPEEVNRYKDRIDWLTLSGSETAFRWNFDLLLKFEGYINFDALTWHRQAWTEAFGHLSDADVETILGNKAMQNDVSKMIELGEKAVEDLDDDWEDGTTKIPECLTYEYFLKTSSK